MRTDALEAVADRGYFNSPEILASHEAGMAVTLPNLDVDEVPLPERPSALAPAAGRLHLPGGASADVSHDDARGRQSDASLLDDGMRGLSAEEEVHNGSCAAHPTLGARGYP